MLIVFLLTGIFPSRAYAAQAWPECADVQAEGAICMDLNSGTILYGKNIHEHFYPASITKILTALLVIENCDMDEEVVFSKRAVYDVEAGSSSAGYDVDDRITVKTALYALLLKSANEAANALAEHVAGSIEGFCDMMNERAAELGCTDTHFANPSGLNNEEHYTSAYDFALICKEAFANDIFLQVDGTTYYTLPASKRNPEPVTVYAHHSMLKKSNKLYYDGIIGGKTGYTSLAGNTLVTCAERENLKLVAIVLNGHQTHYEDTKQMLDFGFENFKSVRISDCGSAYAKVFENMDITGGGLKGDDILTVDEDARITLPKDADPLEVQSTISYQPDEDAPENSIAQIDYIYGGKTAGHTYVIKDFNLEETDVIIGEIEEETMPADTVKTYIAELPLWIKIAVPSALALIIALIVIAIVGNKKRKRKDFKLYTGMSGMESINSDKGKSRRRH